MIELIGWGCGWFAFNSNFLKCVSTRSIWTPNLHFCVSLGMRHHQHQRCNSQAPPTPIGHGILQVSPFWQVTTSYMIWNTICVRYKCGPGSRHLYPQTLRSLHLKPTTTTCESKKQWPQIAPAKPTASAYIQCTLILLCLLSHCYAL